MRSYTDSHLKVNDRFLEITGYSREQYAAGELSMQNLSPDEYHNNERDLLEEIQKTKALPPFEKDYLHRSGKRITTLVQLNIINESPLTGILFIYDVSRQKAEELELAEIRRAGDEKVNKRMLELEESMKLVVDSRNSLTYLLEDVNDSRNEIIRVNQQLDAVNKELEAFSYSVSHDLKAPLRAIDGFSRAIEEDYYEKLDAEGKEFINLIRANAQKMAVLINDLLEFSRLGRKEINYSIVNMRDTVDEVYADLIMMEKGRQVNLEINELENVLADRTMIKQVLTNLLSNALKFSRLEKKAKIEIGCQESDKAEEILFYVRDNGVGFDMKYYDKLFGVFQRLHTEDTFEGTGVGLALIQRIITRHKGRIWAEGKPGEGCTFYFTMPRLEDRAESEKTLHKDEL